MPTKSYGVQWKPFEEMLTLRQAMNQLLEDSYVRPTQAQQASEVFAPPIDIRETPGEFIVDAAVPGLKCDDLHVTVENNVLTISGEIRREEESEGHNYHRIERQFGTFQRSMTLPTSVKIDNIQANLDNGVLHLHIPKADEVKPRRITVNVQG